MAKLFGVDIAKLVAQNVGPGAFAATLTKYTNGVYDINDPSAGVQKTSTSYACKVIPDETLFAHVKDDLVRTLVGKITVILGTITTPGIVPAVGDLIVSTPPGLTTPRTFKVIGKVDVDPAGATATCDVEALP